MMTTETNNKSTPTLLLISMLGDEIVRLSGHKPAQLDVILSAPTLPEWFIPALAQVVKRGFSWEQVLQALDLPRAQNDALAAETVHFASSSDSSLIMMAATELLTGDFGEDPTAEDYNQLRAISAPSLGYLAIRGITWNDVLNRLARRKKAETTPVTSVAPDSATPAAYALSMSDQDARTAAKAKLTENHAPTAAPTPPPVEPQSALSTPKRAAKSPASKTWMERYPNANESRTARAIVELMHKYNAFDAKTYRELVAPADGPQPSEVTKRFGPELWFKAQDIYLERYGVDHIPSDIPERYWRAIPLEDGFSRMFAEAKRLGLSSEIAYNNHRHPALAPASMTMRQLCQEQGVSYTTLRNRFFGLPQTDNPVRERRKFTTYPLDYVVSALHDGLVATKARTIRDYDRLRNPHLHPSITELERVAARHSRTAREVYGEKFTEPAFPE
ncbi:hypothetical protein [Lacticaseibacillus hulanensis]|uniref:hypothetical protein n=1 Tax=Lacticaseibacillus hulanensis TaxID=2493111 RepID=UPI000FDB50DE|nr:hypothetical protein [Lacticaseibacillus hulanensis]